MLNNREKNIKSFRKALLVPFFLCIITAIPSVKGTYEWFELKTLDLLFTYYPEICLITGNKVQLADPPAIVITKDQSFQTKFGRSPNRKDFAKLLNRLKSQGVKVAALDFIFDEATKEEEDREFAEEIKAFPYPILAHNFVSRGIENFNLVDIREDDGDRPPWPNSLYKPISDNAATKGLINIPSGLDAVIRHVPLAFHPKGYDFFLPTLGFATYIATLLGEEDKKIAQIDISKNANLAEAMDQIYKAAPYDFNSTGHDGLDKSIFSLEALYIFRNLLTDRPNLIQANRQNSFEIVSTYSKPKNKTWLNLPKEPLPLIGNYHTPSIRIPYKKQAPPLKDDAIKSLSMSYLMETETEEANSVFILNKNFLFKPEENSKNIQIQIPQAKSGNKSMTGEIRKVTGEGVASATIWGIMPQTGYWQKTKTDSKGKYELKGLPEGNFVISAYISRDNGWDKATLNIENNEECQKLPLLMLGNCNNKIKIPSELVASALGSELWLHGEVIPMLHSNSEGYCGTKSIPEGYSLIGLSDDEESFSIDSEGKLLVNEEICNETCVAVMPEEESWQLKFYRKYTLDSAKDIVLEDIPSSLDSVIMLTNQSTTNLVKSKEEQIIKPGSTLELTKLPKAFKEIKPEIKLNINFPKEASQKSKVILLGESGKEYELLNSSYSKLPYENYLIMTEFGNARGLYKPSKIDKKVVFIGTSLATDQDFIVTPINFLDQSFTRMSGVKAHANLFAALMNQEFFYTPPFHMDRSPEGWPFYQWLLLFPIFWLLNIKFKNAESTKSTLIVLTIIFSLAVTAIFLFPNRILIPVFYPSFMIFTFSVTRGFVEWINSRRQAKQTQNAFSRFISADVVAEIVNNPDAIKPGGEKKELTIIFTDIAGFTSISEKLAAEELTELMNNYLDEMTNILFKHGGTLDKYIGDAIMGFWNHPTPQENHAARAVSCAIEMQKKLHELREKWMAQGLPKVEMRAGINSGTCMVGFIGSKTQMNFTCLGDSVNLASRLEGANKAYNTFIMVAESVKKQLNPYLFSTRFLDFLAVKGKDKPVLVYEVRGWVKEETDVWKNKASVLYQHGIDSYLAREWDKSRSLFEEVLKLIPEDGPSKVYIERCLEFKVNPPPEKWDGRYILKTK